MQSCQIDFWNSSISLFFVFVKFWIFIYCLACWRVGATRYCTECGRLVYKRYQIDIKKMSGDVKNTLERCWSFQKDLLAEFSNPLYLWNFWIISNNQSAYNLLKFFQIFEFFESFWWRHFFNFSIFLIFWIFVIYLVPWRCDKWRTGSCRSEWRVRIRKLISTKLKLSRIGWKSRCTIGTERIKEVQFKIKIRTTGGKYNMKPRR